MRCGWEDCLNCKQTFDPLADEDESVLAKHNEELIIGVAHAEYPGVNRWEASNDELSSSPRPLDSY